MDLNSLRIFLAVAEKGSVSKAAETLNCVQSNVTARIKNLEEDVDKPLFYRRSRGMALTPEGDCLLGYARKMMKLAEEAKEAIKGDGEPKGKITFGSIETTAAIRLPGYLAQFNREYPQVEINLHTGTSAELEQLVLEYRLEGAFVGGVVDHPDIEQLEMFSERMVLIAREGVSGLDDPEIKALIGFKDGCSYQTHLDIWLASLGRQPLKTMRLGSLEAIIGCVRAGMGVALMPASVLENNRYGKGLAVHSAPKRFSSIPTMFIRRKDMPLSTNLSAFLSMVQA